MTVEELHKRLGLIISWGLGDHLVHYVEKNGDVQLIQYQWRDQDNEGTWGVMLG